MYMTSITTWRIFIEKIKRRFIGWGILEESKTQLRLYAQQKFGMKPVNIKKLIEIRPHICCQHPSNLPVQPFFGWHV